MILKTRRYSIKPLGGAVDFVSGRDAYLLLKRFLSTEGAWHAEEGLGRGRFPLQRAEIRPLHVWYPAWSRAVLTHALNPWRVFADFGFWFGFFLFFGGGGRIGKMVQTVEDSCVDHTCSGRILGSLYVIVAHVTLNNSKDNIHFLGYIF